MKDKIVVFEIDKYLSDATPKPGFYCTIINNYNPDYELFQSLSLPKEFGKVVYKSEIRYVFELNNKLAKMLIE